MFDRRAAGGRPEEPQQVVLRHSGHGGEPGEGERFGVIPLDPADDLPDPQERGSPGGRRPGMAARYVHDQSGQQSERGGFISWSGFRQFAPEFADQVLGAGEGAARKQEPVPAAGAAARGRFQVENHVVSRNPPQEAVRQREAFGVELDVQQADRAAVRKTMTRMALNEKEIPRRNRIFDSVDDLGAAAAGDQHEFGEVVEMVPFGQVVRMLSQRGSADFGDRDRQLRRVEIVAPECFFRIFRHHGDIIPVFVEKFKENPEKRTIFQ